MKPAPTACPGDSGPNGHSCRLAARARTPFPIQGRYPLQSINSASVRRNEAVQAKLASGYPFEDAYGYSRAVRLGNQVLVSGTTARPPQLAGDAYFQARAALAIVAEGLSQAGAELRHVVRTVVYVVDMADAPLVAPAHAEGFGAVRPASTSIQMAALTPASARVEVEATAIIAD